MNYDPFDAIVQLNQAENMDDLCRIFERIMCKYGFDLFALQFTPSEKRHDIKTVEKKPIIIATFDQEWVNHYFEEKYHDIDPVINIGSKSKHPFLWSDTWKGIELDRKQKKFFHEANDFGVSAGVGLPILSPYLTDGMVSLVSSCISSLEVNQIVNEHAHVLQLLASHFQQKACYFAMQQKKPEINVLLSPREKECLTWAAQGKSDREIGMLLGISHRTVNHHMSNAMAKLDSYSREYAVVKALMANLIEI